VSGGAGEDERQELLAKERDYTLKVVVAAANGDFLADVQVSVESSKKEPVLATTMDGPILLAKLAPGTYTVKATLNARTQPRTGTIGGAGLRELDFRWPASTGPSAAR